MELSWIAKTMAHIRSLLSSPLSQKMLLSQRHHLNSDSLWQVKNKWENLGLDEGMEKCFQVVMENFPEEPPWVMKNAQMVLKGNDGEVLRFASGKKEWKINVSAEDNQYHVKAPSKSAYLARLRFRQQPLSIQHFKKVVKDLETWGPLTPAEKSCFMMALQKFSQKPFHIQSNAEIKFIFDMDGGNVEFLFISGNGDCKMKVTYSSGQPQYHELNINSDNTLEDLSCSMQRLDVENLRELQNEIAQRDFLTDNLNLCFNHLVDKLPEYSNLLGENLQINFTCSKEGLFLISQSEKWEITVQSHDGNVDFNIKLHTCELFLKHNKNKKCTLTVEKLEEIRTELRTLQGTTRSILDMLNKALNIFSQQMSCVQKNAHLVIEHDQGEMVFISGKGENKIDIFYVEEAICNQITYTWPIKLLYRFLGIPKEVVILPITTIARCFIKKC